jgi:hypothetical protein
MYTPSDEHNYVTPSRRGFGLYYDPLYGYIPLTPTVREALDTPSMQRLRHIKQLSTVYLVFPGATHSRFEHSVGVCYLADKVWEVLHNKRQQFNRKDWPDFDPIYRIALSLASVFHDIGHGPWSHVFELFCKMKQDYRRLEHKKITKDWISKGFGGFTDIPPFISRVREKVKKRYKAITPPEDWEAVDDHIEKILTPQNIGKMAVGEPISNEYAFLSNIIDGVFDVDRMDYLRRDAFYTGIETGRVDVWEIIHSYTLIEADGKWYAGLSREASTAVEALLAIRDLVYRMVYYHPVHRCAQEMMIRGMCEIVSQYGADKLATLTDGELLKAFEGGEGNAFTKDIAQRIRLRAIYHELPFSVNVSRDLDSQSKSNWSEFAITGLKRDEISENWLRHEKTVSEKLELPTHQRVIFDIRRVPITERSEYNEKLFIDERSNDTFSLLDLLPHLGLTRGTREIRVYSDELEKEIVAKRDLTTQYIEEISNILIFIPFEYLNDMVNDIVNRSRNQLNREDLADLIHQKVEMMKPIIFEIIDFLGVEDVSVKNGLNQRYEEKLTSYFEEMLIERISE